MSNLLFAIVVMLTFVGSVWISKPTSYSGGKILKKEDNLKFKLIVECSFFDNKFLCKEKKLRLSES